MGYLDNYVKTVDANNAYAKAVKKAKTYVSSSNNDLEEAHKIIYNAVVSNVDDDKIYKLASTLAKTGNSVDDILTFNSEQNTNKLENLETSFVEGLKSGGKGLITAVTGYTNTGWQAPSYEQYQLNQTRDDEKWTLYNIGLDATYGVGNMAPSLALWAINPVAGGITMFSSSAGEAYNQALYEGKSESEAQTYGTIIGAVNTLSEKTLGLLGNFKLAKSALGKVAGTSIAKSTIGRLTAAVGSEFTDEFVQQILQPVIQNVTLSGDEYTYKNNPINFEDALYNGVIGGITGGIFEGGRIVGTNATTSKIDRTIAKNVEQSASAVNATPEFTNSVSEAAVSNRIGVRITDGITQVDPNTKTLYINKDFNGDVTNYINRYAKTVNNIFSVSEEDKTAIFSDPNLTVEQKIDKIDQLAEQNRQTDQTNKVQDDLNSQIELTGDIKTDRTMIDAYIQDEYDTAINYTIKDGKIVVENIKNVDFNYGRDSRALEEAITIDGVIPQERKIKQKENTAENKMRNQLAKLKEKYDADVKEANNYEDLKYRDRLLVKYAKKYAASKRAIIQGKSLEFVNGGLTELELKKVIDKLNSNYKGKTVTTPDGEGIIDSVETKKIRVKLSDGKVKDYEPSQIESEIINYPTRQETSNINEVTQSQEETVQNVIKRSEILSTVPENKTSAKNQIKDTFATVKRAIVDIGESVESIAKLTKDSYIYPLYNGLNQATNMANRMLGGDSVMGEGKQINLNGKVVGENLQQILKPIKDGGEAYFNKFQEYLYHKHNIDRVAQNKGVWDINESQSKVIKYEAENTEFRLVAEKVYAFNRNLLQMQVDSGMITRRLMNTLNQIYPHYVPLYRATDQVISSWSGKEINVNSPSVKQVVKVAKGGENYAILPVDYNIGVNAHKTVRESQQNLLLNRIYSLALKNDGVIGDKVAILSTQQSDVNIDNVTDESFEPALVGNNTIRLYRNGEATDIIVDKGTYKAFELLRPKQNELLQKLDFLRKINTTLRNFETTFNFPGFTISNALRDNADAMINSKDTIQYLKAYPEAMKGLAKNDSIANLYQNNGGIQAGFIQDQNLKAKNIASKVVKKIEYANMYVEQVPRFTEFVATLKKSLGVDYETLTQMAENGTIPYLNIKEAMYNAADITVNFGRGGWLSKTYSAYVRRYFNAGVQGFDRFIRTVTGARGFKGWASLTAKAVLFGVLPSVINAAICGDEEDWEDIPQEWKDKYYLFPLGDKKWLKVPKGRIASVFGMTSSIISGDSDFASFFTTANEQVGFPNPFESTIVSPIFEAINNKGWWGGAIENQAMQNYLPKDRYDAGTTYFAKAIGQALNVSPKKVDYILNAYSGVIGDYILPLATQKAEKDPITSRFVLDSIDTNKSGDEFYNTITELTQAKNSGDKNAVLTLRYLNSQKSAVSDLYNEIKSIQNSDLSDSEKTEKVREVKAIINGIEKNALMNLDSYKSAVEKYYKGGTDSEVNYQYALVNQEVFGSEYALSKYNSDVYRASQTANTLGVDYDTYFDFYFATKDLTAQDEYGTTKTGEKKRKIVGYINSLDIPYEQKLVLIKMKEYPLSASEDSVVTSIINDIGDMSYPEKLILYMDMGYKLNSPDEYKTIVDYVYSMDLTEDEKITMLKGYGFTFNNGSFYYN